MKRSFYGKLLGISINSKSKFAKRIKDIFILK